MSDRTYVHVTYPKWADPIVRPILLKERAGRDDDTCDEKLVYIGDSGCDGGCHPLEDALQQFCIPYDTHWDSGCDYDPGDKTVRYDEKGGLLEFEVFDGGLTEVALEAIKHFRAGDKEKALKVIEEAANEGFYNAMPIEECAPTEKHRKMLGNLARAASKS